MAISREKVIEAIDQGILVANRKYEGWTNGSWVTDAGVESLMVTYIAERLHCYQEPNESLALEVTFGDIREMSGAEPRPGRRPNNVSDTNRADIVIFNADQRPTCMIEVKRSWNNRSCSRDLRRISSLVRQCSHVNAGSLRRGLLAMLLAKQATQTKTAEERIKEQMRGIKEWVNRRFSGNTQNVLYHLGYAQPPGEQFQDLYGAWRAASFCIEISAQNQNA